jgi:hypothetical protein
MLLRLDSVHPLAKGGEHQMVDERIPIRVTAEIDLPTLLDEATKGPLLLERNGTLFRLAREDDIVYEPDAALVRRTLLATAGSWADLDVDEVITDIYGARRAGSRPPDRP